MVRDGTAVIDLGLVTGGPAVDSAAARLAGRGRPSRRAILAGVAVVCAFLPAGATAPGRPMFDPAVSVRFDSGIFSLTPKGIYAYQAEQAELVAYDLATGRRRWAASLPRPAGFAVSAAGDRVLAVAGAGRNETVALDAGTGALLWRHDGGVLWVDAGGDRAAIAGGVAFTSSRSDEPQVSIVDTRTGRDIVAGPIHLRRAGDITPVTEIGPAGEQLAGFRIATPAGGSEWLEFTSGRRHELPMGDTTESYLVAGDLLVGYGASEMRAYDRDGGRLRWTLPGARRAASSMCGRFLCALLDERLVAVDPFSGAVRWTSPWEYLIGLGSRALAVRAPGSALDGLAVVDAETGQVLRNLPGWRPLPADGYRSRLPVLVPKRAGGFQVAVLDLGRLVAYPLGAAPSTSPDECQSVPGYVACRTSSSAVTVWSY